MGRIGITKSKVFVLASLARRSFKLVCCLANSVISSAVRPIRSVYDSIRSEYEGVAFGRTVWFQDR